LRGCNNLDLILERLLKKKLIKINR